MLLRRFTRHISNQNWLAVGLDVAAVAGGVLLALQLQGWFEARGTKARAEAALTELYLESEDVLLTWVELVYENDIDLELQDRVVAALFAGEQGALDADAIEAGLATMGFFPPVNPPRRVYDELARGGLIHEIDAPEAMDAVATYYERLAFIEAQLPFFRPARDGDAGLREGRGINSVYDAERRSRQRIEVDFAALTADPAYLDALSRLLRNRIVFQYYRRWVMHEAAGMCEALARAAGARCLALEAYETVREVPLWLAGDEELTEADEETDE